MSVDGLACLGRQGKVALALDDHRVALAALVVELHVAHLAVLDERVRLVLEAVGLAEQGLPLGREQIALCLEKLGVEVTGVGDAVLGTTPRRRNDVGLTGRGVDGGSAGRRRCRLLGRCRGLLLRPPACWAVQPSSRRPAWSVPQPASSPPPASSVPQTSSPAHAWRHSASASSARGPLSSWPVMPPSCAQSVTSWWTFSS